MSLDISGSEPHTQSTDIVAHRATIREGVLVYTLSENSTPEIIVRKKTELMDLAGTECIILINFTQDIEIETSYVALLVTVVRKLRELSRSTSLGLCVPNARIRALLDSCRLMGNRTKKTTLFSNVFVTVNEAIQQMCYGNQPPYVLRINATKPDVDIYLTECFEPQHAMTLLEMLGKFRPAMDVPVLLADKASEPRRFGRLFQQVAARDDYSGRTWDIETDSQDVHRLLLRIRA